jgi:hypothetical protein
LTPDSVHDAAEAASDLKRCPRCAEDIRPEATRCPHCQADFDGASQGDSLGQWLQGHATTMASIATFLYVAFQIYKAADFEVNTTVEILRAGGLTSILIGVALVQLPFELILLVLAGCWWLMSSVPRTGQSEKLNRRGQLVVRNSLGIPPRVFLAVLLILSFYTSPWPLFLLSLIICAVVWIAAATGSATDRRLARTRRGIAVLGTVAFFIMVQRPTIWVPAESITTADDETIVAYVISEDEPWTTLLTPSWTGYLQPGENSMRRVQTDKIVSRKPCAISFLEAKLFDRVLRLRPAQLITAINQHALPQSLTPPCS